MKITRSTKNEVAAKDVIPISAKKSLNLEIMASEISSYLPIHSLLYPQDMLMDSTERFLAAEVIRKKRFFTLQKKKSSRTVVLVGRV